VSWSRRGTDFVMMPYERFEAWQMAHELALEIYRITDRWPKEERFGVTIQLRRAALSAPTNIAEGAAKRGNKEFRRFLDIALGSLSEVSYLLRFSRDRGLLTPDSWLAVEALRARTGRVTWRLYLAVSRASRDPTQSPPEPASARPTVRPSAG
jgi:four helix bundle protein